MNQTRKYQPTEDVYFQSGVELYNHKRFQQAKTSFEKSIQVQNSSNASLQYCAIAMCLYQTGEKAAAEKLFIDAKNLNFNKKYWQFSYYLVTFYYLQGQYYKANNNLELFEPIMDDQQIILYVKIKYMMQKFQEGLDFIEKHKKRQLPGELIYLQSLCYRNLQNHEKEYELHEQLFAYGIYFEKDDYQTALKLVDNIKNLTPLQCMEKGIILYKLNNFVDSIECLNKAKQIKGCYYLYEMKQYESVTHILEWQEQQLEHDEIIILAKSLKEKGYAQKALTVLDRLTSESLESLNLKALLIDDEQKKFDYLTQAIDKIGRQEKVLALSNTYADIYYNLTVLSLQFQHKRSNQFSPSEFLRMALNYNPKHTEALITRGDLYFNAKQYNEALQHYREVQGNDIQFKIMMCLYNLNRFEECLLLCKQLIQKFDDKQQNVNDCIVLKKNAFCEFKLQRYSQCLEELEKVFLFDRENPVIWNLKGECLRQLKGSQDQDEVHEHFKYANKLSPNNFEYIFNTALYEEDEDNAIKLYAETIEIMPTYMQAYINISKIYYKQSILLTENYHIFQLDKQNKSLEYLDMALRIQSSHQGVLQVKAQILFEQNEYMKAIQSYEQIVEKDATETYNMCLMYYKFNCYDDAIGKLLQLVQNQGNQDNSQQNKYLLGKALMKNEKFEEAMEQFSSLHYKKSQFREAICSRMLHYQSPTQSPFSKELAEYFLKRGEFKIALEYMEEDYDNYFHYYNKGCIYEELEEYNTAIEYYQLALNKTENDNEEKSKVLNNLGCCQHKIKNVEEAKDLFIKSLQANPQNEEAQNNLSCCQGE